MRRVGWWVETRGTRGLMMLNLAWGGARFDQIIQYEFSCMPKTNSHADGPEATRTLQYHYSTQNEFHQAKGQAEWG